MPGPLMVSESRMLISRLKGMTPGRIAGSKMMVSAPGLALATPMILRKEPISALERFVTVKVAGAMRGWRSSGA